MKFNSNGHCASISIVIALLAIPPLCYANPTSDKASIEEVKKETSDLIQTLKSYTANQRDEAIRKTKATLDDMDVRIKALQTRINEDWDKMDKATREKAQAGLKSLREQRARVEEWFGRLKSSSVGAWGHMKKGFSDAYGSLYDAWEKSENEFGPDK